MANGLVPRTGLIGSEQALQGGLAGSEDALRRGLAGSLQALEGGNVGLDRLQALSGLTGPGAQQQAFAGFQSSPDQQFIQQQGERALLRNQAAIGGLGGGNVRRELVRFGQGNAAQDFSNQFQRGLSTLQAGQVPASQASQQAFGTGQLLSQGRLGTGQQLAGGRTQAGRDIAQQTAGTTSALSNLIQQQGAGAADIVGGGASNIANLLQGFGGQAGQSQEQLAQLLANLATQQSGQVSSLPSSSQFLNNQGIIGGLGQLAGGVGGAVSALSDRRLKTNIKKVGEHSSGLNIYTWDWLPIADIVEGIKTKIGFMADEVQKLMPEAVILDKSGYFKVNYGMVLNG